LRDAWISNGEYMTIRNARVNRTIGSECREAIFHRIDSRSREAKLLNSYREQRLREIGNPTPAQRLIIEHMAQTQLRLAILAEQFTAKGGDISERAERSWTRYTNTLTRLMRDLEASKQPVKLTPEEAAARVRAMMRGEK
jgi:hypothetical protein